MTRTPDPAVEMPSLLAELRRRADQDQLHRREPCAWDETTIERVKTIDADNRAWLERVIDQHGWPGITLVGTEGAHLAWLLAQHSDDDPGFQQRCLELLRDAVHRKDADAKDLAYLEDRVRRAQGRPQLYGTQCIARSGEQLDLQPVEDPEHVNERRASVGLGPIEEYLQHMRDQWNDV